MSNFIRFHFKKPFFAFLAFSKFWHSKCKQTLELRNFSRTQFITDDGISQPINKFRIFVTYQLSCTRVFNTSIGRTYFILQIGPFINYVNKKGHWKRGAYLMSTPCIWKLSTTLWEDALWQFVRNSIAWPPSSQF